MAAFRILVYHNPVRSNAILGEWTKYSDDISFATGADSGFAECTFTLHGSLEWLRNLVEGTTDAPTYCTNRIVIVDETGFVCYEGIIWALTLHYGAAVLSRSADNLYTVTRIDYQSNTALAYMACATSASARALFGTWVYLNSLEKTFAASSTVPGNVATRTLNQMSFPSKADSTTLGGSADGISLEVSCVGMIATLEKRYAFNASAVASDGSEIVKDMIRAGAITSGNDSGIGTNGWHERLTSTSDTSNNIPYASDFIATRFANVNPTSVTIPRDAVAGETRMAIIQAVCAYGNSTGKRVMFQVWESGNSTTGKGVPYLVAQSTSRTNVAGYTGYYMHTTRGYVLNSDQQQIPLHQIRAGQWITALDLPAATYGVPTNAHNDPRMFWIEHTNYDVNARTMTLSTTNQTNAALILARVLWRSKRMTITRQ